MAPAWLQVGPGTPFPSSSLSSSAPGRAGAGRGLGGVGERRRRRTPDPRQGGAKWGGIETRAPGTREVLRGDLGAQGETPRARRTQVEGKLASVAGAQRAWPRGERKGQVRFHGSAEGGSGRAERVRGDGQALPTSSPRRWFWALRSGQASQQGAHPQTLLETVLTTLPAPRSSRELSKVSGARPRTAPLG